MKVFMYPMLETFSKTESGIKRVIEAYHKYLPMYDIQVVGPNDAFDIIIVHAGASNVKSVDVAMNHGLYWTADYESDNWLWRSNEHVINSLRHAKVVTVPSNWVAEVFQRDMRFTPHVIGHGIEVEKWRNDETNRGYVLWNKNRGGVDVCDPYPVSYLSGKFSDKHFVSTFYRDNPPQNVQVTGLIPHKEMINMVSQCGVYLATTKETFGIGTLEAMAAGKPILGFAYGGTLDIVKHGVNGYLATPGNYDDLAAGLEYCYAHAKTLGENSRQLATNYTWEKAVEKVAGVFRLAAEKEVPLVDVVIPVFNKPPEMVDRAIDSAMSQTMYLGEVIVVDDGSNLYDYTYLEGRDDIKFYRKENGGVATARNLGISKGSSKYVLCLDADDWVKPQFLSACVPPLEEDRSLGITYTGLWYTTPDGIEGLSPWPGDYDYDAQLKRRNQVPTACVFRRELWRRLGGYKQRYAPTGAGSEDAEFWTRAGAYGFGAKKVTDAGLFMYSWKSGLVTGNPHYKEVDWLAMHPWVKDGQHPFASVATPKRHTHPVRQYDQPTVSVIIPVGPNHHDALEMALDSLESQTLRRWEAVVVNDSGSQFPERILNSYPYMRLYETTGQIGAGASRNLGVKHARANLILFLDADDYLSPDALTTMVDEWNRTGMGVYSDYIGRSFVDDPNQLAPDLRARIIAVEHGETIIGYKALDYDCLRASRQPENPPYIWCNITTLIPKAWHIEVGGFDEEMESWEDVDYWWRMAWGGKCFTRVREQLLVYKFYTGNRRQVGLHMWDKLLQYISNKKDSVNIMACGCKDDKFKDKPSPPVDKRMSQMLEQSLDEKMVLVRYMHANRGQHVVVGQAPPKRKYGYRAGGDVFLVHVDDIRLQPHLFHVIERHGAIVDVPTVPNTPPPAPDPVFDANILVEKPYDFQIVPGVTPAIARRLEEAGFKGPEDMMAAGIDGLMKIDGIAHLKAKMIMDFLKNVSSRTADTDTEHV